MEVDGLTYCFDNLYKILSYWGVISFGLKTTQQNTNTTSKRSILAWSIRCLLISGFLSGVLIKRLDPEMSYAMFNDISPVVKVIFSWEYLSCIITYVEYCLSMDFRHHRHIKFVHKLQELDLPIFQEFPQVKWNYQRTQLKYWYGTILVGICYFTLSISLIFDLTKCSCGVLSTLLIATCYSLITSSLGLLGIVHIAIMDYLRLRFRLAQKLIKQTYQAHTNKTATDTHFKILILMKFNQGVSDLVIKLNEVFSFVAAAGIFYEFTLMICFVYVVCQKIIAKQFWDAEYALMILHLSLHSYKVIVACAYGYLLKREKANCMHLLSQLDINFEQNLLVRSHAEIIQHWQLHNNHIRAIIGSTLPCNIYMIYIVYNGIANYVIILVQLLFQQLQINEQIILNQEVEIIKPLDPITHQAVNL
ncbi:uncharacterized protein Dwil_GK19220 [Drosophila willistoni]|uniref:Gustatory receptor n=1 Tax=Drosophila willistoni TaxID=7260 RepID=B4NME3_DROWI|nr:putative gustatory receptor 47b [Drosophila willistoni]EDW85532.1 uncharacterized protein Dwil_GK19220 [Drosophila willistoni]